MADERLTNKSDIEKMKSELSSFTNNKVARTTLYKRKKRSSILYYIILAILVLFLANIIYQRQNNKIPSLFGYYVFKVESGSMQPTLDISDIIIVKKSNAMTEYNVNDIISFKDSRGNTVTHRIVEIAKDDNNRICYKTKGDFKNNTIDKELLYPENIYGIYQFTLF